MEGGLRKNPAHAGDINIFYKVLHNVMYNSTKLKSLKTVMLIAIIYLILKYASSYNNIRLTYIIWYGFICSCLGVGAWDHICNMRYKPFRRMNVSLKKSNAAF